MTDDAQIATDEVNEKSQVATFVKGSKGGSRFLSDSSKETYPKKVVHERHFPTDMINVICSYLESLELTNGNCAGNTVRIESDGLVDPDLNPMIGITSFPSIELCID